MFCTKYQAESTKVNNHPKNISSFFFPSALPLSLPFFFPISQYCPFFFITMALKCYLFIFVFFSVQQLLLLFKCSCLHFPATTFPHLSHRHLPPSNFHFILFPCITFTMPTPSSLKSTLLCCDYQFWGWLQKTSPSSAMPTVGGAFLLRV